MFTFYIFKQYIHVTYIKCYKVYKIYIINIYITVKSRIFTDDLHGLVDREARATAADASRAAETQTLRHAGDVTRSARTPAPGTRGDCCERASAAGRTARLDPAPALCLPWPLPGQELRAPAEPCQIQRVQSPRSPGRPSRPGARPVLTGRGGRWEVTGLGATRASCHFTLCCNNSLSILFLTVGNTNVMQE